MPDNLNDTHNQRAVLLFSCADQAGIISTLANFFAERGLSISRLEEFTDDGHLFLRLEWMLNQRWENQLDFASEFETLASQFSATFTARFFNQTQTIGLFASAQAHALVEILSRHEASYFPNVEISFIVGSDESIRPLADRYATPFFHIPISTDSNQDALDYEQRQIDILHRYRPDFLALAHYTKVLSANFLRRAGCPIINIQPSFMPSLESAQPYRMAYKRGVKLIGASSHFVTAELDQGPIIEQDVCRAGAGASLDEFIQMGREIERKVFARAILKVLQHKTMIHNNRTIVFN
nr:putative formyltetrahydrofolate deformylase [uncultured bacterium]